MIYLIDDKTNRQRDYGWNEQKISFYKDKLVFISRYDQIKNLEIEKNIFSDDNLILFHESFFSNVENTHRKDANDIRNDLIKCTQIKQNFKVIFFSGSYNAREINETGGSIPVSVLYQNLELFLDNYSQREKVDFLILFFGKKPEIENVLLKKRETSNSLLIEELGEGKINCSSTNLVISGNGQGFPIPFSNSSNQTIFNKNVSDEEVNIKVFDWLSEIEFDNLFIPICFGPTLSDYNGLRLATHIRCTSIKNRLKPIFIYSFVDYSNLIENEYFDIIKTKNVFLIEYSKKAFEDAKGKINSPLTIEELPTELKKLNLQIPTNYEDNHSIANEWAIYRWSHSIGANDKSIEKIADIQNSNLYFKYLKTIYPISQLYKLNSTHVKVNYKNNPKILYIDDEAEKGWYEVFCKIFDDENKLFFRHLDDEFNEKSKEEIIDISIKKIIDEDIDLVILDFRLHKDDFGNANIKDITGYQILKKIKEYNRGIQVIIFSATNKIWNLQALQEARADGFIIKESPENSSDLDFTKCSIENFISITEECLSQSFLKYFFSTCDKIKQNIATSYSDPQSLFDDFKKELIVSLSIICESASNIDLSLSSSFDVVFLNCYNFLEKFKHFYVREIDYKLVLGFEEVEMNRYNFNNGLVNNGQFIRISINDNPSFFHSVTALLIDYFKIINSNNNIILKKIYEIKEARNDYIHGDKSNFNVIELIDIINICKTITDNLKE
jgi:CheY-like chemotaxis protein